MLGLLIDLERKFHAPNVTAMLTRIAKERPIVGGSGSEPDNAVINLRPRTTARKAPGGLHDQRAQDFRHAEYRARFVFQRGDVGRRAQRRDYPYVLYSAARDRGAGVQGRLEHDGDAGDRIAQFGIKDAFVPEESVVLTRGVSRSGRVTEVFAKAPFAIGAVYIGIAAAARNFVVDFMRDRPRFPLNI